MSQEERRSFSPEFKLAVIERLEAGESRTALALEFSVKRTIIYRWRDSEGRTSPQGQVRTVHRVGNGHLRASETARPRNRTSRASCLGGCFRSSYAAWSAKTSWPTSTAIGSANFTSRLVRIKPDLVIW